MRTPSHCAVGLIVLIVSVSNSVAIDHSNLEKHRPLRMEDAYPISAGEWALEIGAGFRDRRTEGAQGFFPIQVSWGAAPNVQLDLGSTLFTSPHSIDEPSRSGDLALGVLYNFNKETSMPALALKAEVHLPTGIDSAGVEAELTAIITKSIGRLSFHFNGGYEWLNGNSSGEREGIYKSVIGASYPMGAPMHTRTTLLADVFIEQAHRRGEDHVIGVEIGARHQLTERTVIDAGVGTELAGPPDRARIFAMVGFSITF